MAHKLLISNASIVNQGNVFYGSIVVEDQFISQIVRYGDGNEALSGIDEEFDASGLILLPGIIDTHVHFREPGLTQKADIYTESRAAAVGGVTSFCEMPNTNPPTTTLQLLEQKFNIAAQNSVINYSFFAGATNNNLEQLMQLDYSKICGIKVFMGSSTGNMLVDNDDTLNKLFSNSNTIIVAHCEDEQIIKAKIEYFKELYGENPPFEIHKRVRNIQACYQSTQRAIQLAQQSNARLHVAHISSKRELELFSDTPISNKRITAEVCVPHLWFNSEHYHHLHYRIKCNPSIKTRGDRNALRKALNTNILDTVATDHAPHLLAEKQQPYFLSPSGMPSIQFSLLVMMQLVEKGIITLPVIAQKMCHAPATIFGIQKRGFLQQGYYADITLVNPNLSLSVSDNIVVSKCKWTPFINSTFNSQVVATLVNGQFVYRKGTICNTNAAMPLKFNTL